MTEDRKARGTGSYSHLFEWVEDKLRPIFENPPVAPGVYDAATTINLETCPVCGHPMAQHTIDHSVQNTLLLCPAPQKEAWDASAFEPVNEFGMVRRTPPAKDS